MVMIGMLPNASRQERAELDAPGLSGGISRSPLHQGCPPSLPPFSRGGEAATGEQGAGVNGVLV